MQHIETIMFGIMTVLSMINTLILRFGNRKTSTSSQEVQEVQECPGAESFDSSYYLAKFIECIKKENPENGKN